MAIDVFGNTYVDGREYARKVITQGVKRPFYVVNSLVQPYGGISILFYYENLRVPEMAKTFDVPGIYCLYEKRSDGTYSPLYVGSGNVYNRVYRFVKELHGMSRHDEGHPAGLKARKDGVDPNTLYMKFIPQSELPAVSNLRTDLALLDEAIAPLIKTRYNVRKKF